MRYLLHDPTAVLALALQHLEVVALAVAAAFTVGMPSGVAISRLRWLELPIVNTAGVLYTVPSLALFAILVPVTGLGASPAVIALALYSLLVIVRNTLAGLDSVERSVLDAARGMGMTGAQRLLLVELPLGMPVIVAGVRVAAVSAIGINTVAAYIGAGGLGDLIFAGIRTLDMDRVVAGAVAASVLALLVDGALLLLERALGRSARRRPRLSTPA
jgi:osmoprotectant transport system permease protein